jgi:hypothetical protein
MDVGLPPLSFIQTSDGRIEITLADGSPIAHYLYDEKLPKPCFHPLSTPAGHQITAFQPPDHIWHRGLWFAIKFINQSNFWEERPPFGIQKALGQPDCKLTAPDTLQIIQQLEWTSQATGPVIREHRTIAVSALPDGSRQIDWTTHLEALQNLLLDRTPYTTWGGYGGLAFRAAPEVHGATYLLPDGQSTPNIAGQHYPWALMRAFVNANDEDKISIGMIDHPQNLRSPIPWNCRSEEKYNVMYAAFLFHEPMTLAKGGHLTLRHRILYRDGWWDAEEFAKLASAFHTTSG